MDLRQIRTFVALYEEGRITRAALRLHVVQPAVSQQIKRLETLYGTQLFVRRNQSLIPNALAHELYRHSIRVLAELDKAHALLKSGADRIGGKINVGAQSSFHQFVIARTLQRFSEIYPDVEVLSRDGYRSDLIAWMTAGDLDFSILSTAQDLLSMQTRDLSSEALVVVGHRDTLNGRNAIEGRELKEFRLVLPSRFKSLRNLIDAQFQLEGVTLRPRLEVDSIQSLLHVTLTPGWLSIVPPTALSPEMFGSALEKVSLVKPLIRRRVIVAWPPHKTLEAPAVRFLQVLVQGMSEIPGVDTSSGGDAIA
ncbi:MAG: LysR family transcriptional regulator [Hyphomicrobiales bacterium]|nr:MAG: LysR family transcriptional regulator [Hyphomicrobiales bacterium]